MQIRHVTSADLPAVYELLISNGWRHRVRNLAFLEELVAASSLAEVAIVEGRVVGFVRGISDGLSNGYLSMLVVEEAYRTRGIGRRLLEYAIGTNTEVTWVVRAGRKSADAFFGKLGFTHSSIAMERKRN